MSEYLYVPNASVKMTPIEGLRFYADALRGDWGSIDGRSEKHALNKYIDWAGTVDVNETTEVDVFRELERSLNVYVVGSTYEDRPRGIWVWFVEDEIAARDA